MFHFGKWRNSRAILGAQAPPPGLVEDSGGTFCYCVPDIFPVYAREVAGKSSPKNRVVSGNSYLGLAGYVIHSQVLPMRSVSPAAIAGVRGCQ